MPRRYALIGLLFLLPLWAGAQFRVAQLTDIHLSRSNPHPQEDLQRSIDDINAQDSIALVLVTGDITEAGDETSLQAAYKELKRLRVPFCVTSGNHETTWSESGCTVFPHVFGSDRFARTIGNIFFIGFNSGPKLKMSDGHVVPQDLRWMKACLDTLPEGRMVVAVTHYPMQEGDVDNWYEVTELFRGYNTQFFLGGHYHRNLLFNADGIPNVLQRSNLRGKDSINGYGLLYIYPDRVDFAEKRIGQPARVWQSLPLGEKHYTDESRLPRPSFEVNDSTKVRVVWRQELGVGIYNAAAVSRDSKWVMVGDDEGILHAFSAKDGSERWQYRPEGTVPVRIPSAPVTDEGYVYYTTTQGDILCLKIKNGQRVWRTSVAESGANQGQYAVSGCPIVVKTETGRKLLLVGGNGYFYALDAGTGELAWKTPIEGYCVSRPCVYDDKVYFGAWGCYFYALNLSDGTPAWRWSNGKHNDKFSPAAVWPVVAKGKVYIVAPDRYMTCLSAEKGEEIWRTNENMVRENIGISPDGSKVYARCMRDTVFALDTEADEVRTIWKRSADYGYDHNPSMMVELPCGQIVFGTKNGLLHGVDAQTGEVLWRYKVGNCLINTITPIGRNSFIATSSDGQIIRIIC